MKKKTIIFVSLALVFAIVAIVVIAKIPKQNYQELLGDIKNPVIESGNLDIEENELPNTSEIPEVQGEDDGYLGDEEDALQLLPPVVEEDDDLTDVDELQTVAKIRSATLKAEMGAFKGDVKVELNKLGIFDEEYHRADFLMSDYAKKFVAYKYTATLDGKPYYTSGRVKLIINIPKTYDIDKVSVCHLFDDHVQVLNCYINKNNRTAIVSATTQGVYLLVEKKPVTDKPSDNDSSNDTSSNTSSDNTNTSIPEGDPESMEGWTPWF